MIIGLGVDLCSVSRMERAVRSRHFVERVFRPSEIAYADEKGKAAASSYASAFAAREAFAKASGLSFTKIAISSQFCLKRENGVPRVIVPRELDSAFERGEKRAWVSLSHDGDYAVAVVVLESL
ncbi:holo-[acyl-carrier-protein] synthase [Synergistales bacterium]|nr:holo-[acyl-carrier-protein] synthase [Synergistales bacterium]